MQTPPGNRQLTEVAAGIVSAYVSNNAVPALQLSALIADVYGSLNRLLPSKVEPTPQVLTPAVPVKKSVHADFIICLEDGKKFKSLRRHLATAYGLSPDEYRKKWNLPADYPMVAPNYAAHRSELAKGIGLGRKMKAPPPPALKRARRKIAIA